MFEILEGESEALSSMPVVGKRRHHCSRRVLVYLSEGPRQIHWLARTQNISQEGIAVVAARPFDPGFWLTFNVESLIPTEYWTLEGLVIHSTPKDQNQWLVGCKLATVLTISEIQEFLGEA